MGVEMFKVYLKTKNVIKVLFSKSFKVLFWAEGTSIAKGWTFSSRSLFYGSNAHLDRTNSGS